MTDGYVLDFMTLEIFLQLFYWHGDLPSSWIRGFSRFPIAYLLIFLEAIYEDLGQIDRPEFSRPGKVKAAICELNQAYFFPLRNYRSQDCQKSLKRKSLWERLIPKERGFLSALIALK